MSKFFTDILKGNKSQEFEWNFKFALKIKYVHLTSFNESFNWFGKF